jgi:periplasmic divalent cation tolerance protein
MEDDEEVLMVVKTRRALFPDLMKRVRELHRYSVPEIIALPVVEGSEEYLGWLKEETA